MRQMMARKMDMEAKTTGTGRRPLRARRTDRPASQNPHPDGQVLPTRGSTRRQMLLERLWDQISREDSQTPNPPWAAGAFLAASLLFALGTGGYLTPIWAGLVGGVNEVVSGTGLSAEKITVVGREHASMDDILTALGVTKGESIARFDTDSARQRVEQIGWVSSARVMRLLPDRIVVEIEERKPYAVWQHKGVFRVVDRTGVWLNGLHAENFTFLPHVVGSGAETRVEALMAELGKFPDLNERLEAAVFVAGRRWNLKFANDVKVMLPEGDIAPVLAELSALQAEHGILGRDVQHIDFRLSDRITMRLTDEAMERRKKGFEAARKAKRRKAS